jgi:pectinesterase
MLRPPPWGALALAGLLALPTGAIQPAEAQEDREFVVDQLGGGDFATIQGAMDSLPARGAVTVHIRNGLYAEKVLIRRSDVTLIGEHRDSTRIVLAVLREEWNRVQGGSDWGSGVVNIDTGVSNVTLANLTIMNNHGSLYGTYNRHQFALRGAGTRIILLHCAIRSDGGDAVSLWNRESGMYYHASCVFEGWVDFVCPRGWCYVTQTAFFGHNRPSASIWHDGSGNRSQKFVITDSFFDGVSGFPLGRNHLDAQFYLLRCRFSANMADRPFYRPPSSPRPWQWGARHYFFACHRDGGDYTWFADNLESAEGSPREDQVTARWTFDRRWDPESSLGGILPFASVPFPAPRAERVDPGGVRLRWIPARGARTYRVFLGRSDRPELVAEVSECVFDTGPLVPRASYTWRVEAVAESGTVSAGSWSFSTE